MSHDDEFYVGWANQAPPGIAGRVRFTALVLFSTSIGLGVLLALAQSTIGVSVFEWGTVRPFSGILEREPYPHLLVPRPGVTDRWDAFSSYYLVDPFKFGFSSEAVRPLEGKPVSLMGTLIYRGGQTMIEVVRDSIRPSTGMAEERLGSPMIPRVSLGRQTLQGEIVDSKCYLGVMNPGALIPHRACAIRCISGGIPPILLVRQVDGPSLYYLLVSRDGRAVNQEVLELVAEPVEITGEVEQQGSLLILKADPATYRRVSP
jgi:hypothetical protein